MSITIYPVPESQTRDMASFLAPALVAAADRSQGQVAAQELMRGVLEGDLTAWLVLSSDNGVAGVITTAILKFPHKMLAEIVSAAVDLPEDDWMAAFYPELEHWAKSYGCTGIEATGRVGWGRALKRFGFKPQFVTVSKEFCHA